VQHSPVPVRKILADVKSLFHHQMKSKGLSFTVEEVVGTVILWADPDRTLQILTNLLSNAIKFTPRGGWITITTLRDGSGGVLFTVTDSGIGIPVDELEKAFASFYQIDGSTTRHYGGTGLGLTISRRLAELMGGNLKLDSAGVDQGTSARLLLEEYSPERHGSA